MAIFRRDPPAERPKPAPAEPRPSADPTPRTRPAPERPSAGGNNVTLIARGSRFDGKISGSAEVVVEGEVDGEVELDGHIQIGSNGEVRGNVLVRSARIAGRLVGDVRGREVVELTATGKLEGDVAAPRVIIAEGAFFRGNIEMTDRQKSAGPVPPAAEKSPTPERG